MAKINRGKTTKLSIKLSAEAKQKIAVAAKNLNLSKSGVILFALSNILKERPDKSSILNLESRIILEPENFPITIHMDLSNQINDMQKEYDMNKNVFVGLMVSNYFESRNDDYMEETDHDTTPRKTMIQINESLKKKMIEYSETHFIPLSGLITYAIMRGPYDRLPIYTSNEVSTFYTTIPRYLITQYQKASYQSYMKEHFYIELCLYKAFMGEEPIFV